MARTDSPVLLAALALIAPSVGCTVHTYSMPPSYAPASYESAPRYASASRPRSDRTPEYAVARAQREPKRVAADERKPKKPLAYTPIKPKKPAKPAMYSGAAKSDRGTEHEPKKPLSYTPNKPKRPLHVAPSKPEKEVRGHTVAKTGVLGDTRRPKAESKRGGIDSISERVAARARKARLERESKGVPADETIREHERKKRMKEALAAATKRKRD